VLASIVIIVMILVIRACQGGSSLDVKGYVDSVRPWIQSSSETADGFKQIQQSLNTLTRDQLSQRLDALAKEATALYDQARRSLQQVPPFAISPHGHLLTALKARSVGLVDIRPAMLQANVNPDEGVAIQTFKTALLGLVLGDQAYQFFSDEIKAELDRAKQKSEVPVSYFIRNTDLARSDRQDEFVRSIRTAEKLKATQNLSLVSFKSVPDALRPEGDIFVLPPAEGFELIVTVKNSGNVRVEQIQIKAALTSQINPEPQSSSAIIDVLEPGETKQEVIRGLRPDRGDPVNRIELEIVAPADVDQIDNAASFKFTMAKG
jgi:hypothetical protein